MHKVATVAGVLLFASVLVGALVSAAPQFGAEKPDLIQDAADVDEVVTIKAVGSSLEFETEELELEAGTTVTLRLDNEESTMPHNIVLLSSREDIQQVGIAALQAHDNEYVPESEEERIIGYTSLASPGDVVEFTFTVPPPGEYPYICTYPGHFQTMQGTLTSVEP